MPGDKHEATGASGPTTAAGSAVEDNTSTSSTHPISLESASKAPNHPIPTSAADPGVDSGLDDGDDEDYDDDDELDIDASPSTFLDLLTTASLAHAKQVYPLAADMYSTAAAVQDILYGEMTPSNAEVLFLYGQSLFKVAVESSDVLGGRGNEEVLRGNGLGATGSGRVDDLTEPIRQQDKGKDSGKGHIHFADDELDQDEDEDEEAGEDGEAEAEGDEFADAYEMLEVARVLFERVKEHVESTPEVPLSENVAFTAALENTASAIKNDKGGKGKESEPVGVSPAIILRHAKSRLAAIHDYQAEIFLESERFHDAIREFEIVLDLREGVEPEQSSLIAEGRYKLALAMEFASLDEIRKAQQEHSQGKPTPPVEVKADNGEGSSASTAAASATDTTTTTPAPPKVDEALRGLAADMMQRAVDSCHLRVKLETERLEKETKLDSPEREALQQEIDDVKDMISDMKQRVEDLRSPVDMATVTAGAAGGGNMLSDGMNLEDALGLAISSVFGGAGVGGVSGGAGKEIDTKARDISGLVKTKRKRDVEDEEGNSSDSKKAKN